MAVLCILTLYGGTLRFFRLGAQSLWLDEGVSVLHSRAILEHAYPLLPNGRVSWDSFPVHYLMAIGINAPTALHLGARIMPCLFGTAAIPLMFFLCRDLSRSRLHGLLAAGCVAVSTLEIAWSRQARLYPFLQFFTLASILCANRYSDTLRFRHLSGAVIVAALAILTHRAGYIAAVSCLLLALPMIPRIWRHVRHGKRPALIQLAAAASGFAVVVGGILVIPSHSNLIDATKRIMSTSSVNYFYAYLCFLFQQMGLLLPLSALGMIIGAFASPRKSVPLAAGTLLYFAVISFAWRYFAFRYSFPLVAPLLVFATIPIAAPFFHVSEYRRGIVGRGFACAILLAVSVVGADATFVPKERYLLGYTAPQPEWKDAYDMIRERERRLYPARHSEQRITTVSAIPLFHDIYLGQEVGRKYYLPISFTGYPGDVAGKESYTTAGTIHSLGELLTVEGYLILDDFGMRMLVDKDIQQYLAETTPNAVLKHGYNIFIWILNGEKKGTRESRMEPNNPLHHTAGSRADAAASVW